MSIILTKEQVLARIPQQKPFRFVDEILEISDLTIQGSYRFKQDEFFYAGHFPGHPITPGVILIEAMAQIGVVALGIYILSKETTADEAAKYLTFFTDSQIEFYQPVLPGERVITTGERVFWRQKKLRSKVEMKNEAGVLIASGIVSGIGVKR